MFSKTALSVLLIISGALAEDHEINPERPTRKTLVPHAHPLLKEAYEAHGYLLGQDFAAAAAAPAAGLSEAREKAVAAHKAARLGSTNDDITSSQCDEHVHTSGISYPESYDDDFWGGYSPSECASAGYSDEAKYLGFDDCLTCNNGASIVVLYSDCTGLCATSGDGAHDYYLGLGFGDLDSSACDAVAACYDFDVADYHGTGGTNTQFIGSYSYSFSDDDYLETGTCLEEWSDDGDDGWGCTDKQYGCPAVACDGDEKPWCSAVGGGWFYCDAGTAADDDDDDKTILIVAIVVPVGFVVVLLCALALYVMNRKAVKEEEGHELVASKI